MDKNKEKKQSRLPSLPGADTGRDARGLEIYLRGGGGKGGRVVSRVRTGCRHLSRQKPRSITPCPCAAHLHPGSPPLLRGRSPWPRTQGRNWPASL